MASVSGYAALSLRSCHFRLALRAELHELLYLERRRVPVALGQLAAHLPEHLRLLLLLDAFGDGAAAEVAGHVDDRFGRALILGRAPRR